MRQLLTALPLALSLAAPAFAETREERLAIASEYVDSTLQDIDMEALIRTMWQPLVDQMTEQEKEVSDEQRAEIQALYMKTFEHRLKTIMKDQSIIMADLFTMAELEALRDFYATPEGRAIMQKLPKVMQQLQPEILEMVEQTLPDLMPKLTTILKLQQ